MVMSVICSQLWIASSSSSWDRTKRKSGGDRFYMHSEEGQICEINLTLVELMTSAHYVDMRHTKIRVTLVLNPSAGHASRWTNSW